MNDTPQTELNKQNELFFPIIDLINRPSIACDDQTELDRIFCEDSQNSLKVFHLNINGIQSNFNQLTIFLSSLNYVFDVIVLTETHIKYCTSDFSIPGFKTHYYNAKLTSYDGIIIYINNLSTKDVKVCQITQIANANVAKISLTSNSILYDILAIYRTPSRCANTFIKELDSYLDLVQNKNLIIIGDININIADAQAGNNTTNKYLNTIAMHGLRSLINEYTRISPISKTCIDHIMIRQSSNIYTTTSAIYKVAITDHYAIALKWDQSKPSINNTTIGKTYKKTIIDHDKLLNLLENETWDLVHSTNDVNEATTNFVTIFNNHIQNASQTKTFKINSKNKPLKPWITIGLIKSIRVRDNLKQKLNKKNTYNNLHNLPPDNILILRYKAYRNLLNRLVRVAKDNYYKTKFADANNDIRKTWQLINEATDSPQLLRNNDKIQVSNPQIPNNDPNNLSQTPHETAEIFINYFGEIGKKLAADINIKKTKINPLNKQKPANDNRHKLKRNENSIFFKPINNQEVLKYISELKSNSSAGIDNIQASTIKLTSKYIVNQLVHIFNLSLQEGTFPDHFKTATIVPIHKHGDKTNVGNYRPISILNHLSKLFEKSIKTRITEFFTKHNILSKNQFGFQTDLSTNDAICSLTSHIYKSVDSNKKTLAIFIDLAKAFDTVNHKLLLNKLETYGIRGCALKLLTNYLHKRTQYVKIENTLSSPCYVEHGVPQGTVLGPLLFLVYINDLCELAINGNIVSYADDTALIFSGDTWIDVYRTAVLGFNFVSLWLQDNLLTLNISKTIMLAFQLRNTDHLPDLTFHSENCTKDNCTPMSGCYVIKKAESAKYLGITIDTALSWKEHINDTTKKLRYILYKFYKLRYILKLPTLKMLYFALVQSRLIYGNLGWGAVRDCHLKPIQKLQKRVIKIILHKPIRYQTNLLFKEINVMDIRQLYLKSLLLHAFLNYKPKNITNTHELHTTRFNTHSINCKIPQVNKATGQKHTTYLAPKIYNKLPINIKRVSNIIIFKKLASTWVVEKGLDFSKRFVAADLEVFYDK